MIKQLSFLALALSSSLAAQDAVPVLTSEQFVKSYPTGNLAGIEIAKARPFEITGEIRSDIGETLVVRTDGTPITAALQVADTASLAELKKGYVVTMKCGGSVLFAKQPTGTACVLDRFVPRAPTR